MIEPVKTLRKAMVDGGISDSTNYIRIRPYENDSKLRIRADVKPKEGTTKFALRASWSVPAFDAKLRPTGWATPTWANVAANQAGASSVNNTILETESL